MTHTKFTPCGQYEITSDGRVLSAQTNWRGYGQREMRQHIHKGGYPCVRLTVDGVRKRRMVHQLVAVAFHGPKPTPEHEVRHLDGNPENNHKDNLKWGTRSENALDRSRHGRSYQPPWHDPEFRKTQSASMRGVNKCNRLAGDEK